MEGVTKEMGMGSAYDDGIEFCNTCPAQWPLFVLLVLFFVFVFCFLALSLCAFGRFCWQGFSIIMARSYLASQGRATPT